MKHFSERKKIFLLSTIRQDPNQPNFESNQTTSLFGVVNHLRNYVSTVTKTYFITQLYVLKEDVFLHFVRQKDFLSC